jgi:hypothetical protein
MTDRFAAWSAVADIDTAQSEHGCMDRVPADVGHRVPRVEAR